jgi:hypothetical protein
MLATPFAPVVPWMATLSEDLSPLPHTTGEIGLWTPARRSPQSPPPTRPAPCRAE